MWWFAFSALKDLHTSCMTCGPGPPCHRLGCFGARRARFSAAFRGTSEGVFLEKGFTSRAAVTLLHFLQLLHPFAFKLSKPPLHSRSSAFRRRSRHGLASSSRALLVRGGTQPGAQLARMGRAGVRGKGPRRRLSPRRSRRRGVHALRLLPLLRVGAVNLAFLPAAAGGARPPTSAPHAPLHPPGGHLRPPLQDVHGGGSLHLPLLPFLRVGEIWEGQGPYRCLLLPDKAGFGRRLHPHFRRREVGKLTWRLGGRQRRGQRPPCPAERQAKTCTGQDQELGSGWPDIDARGRRLLEAPDHAAAAEGVPVLLVHRHKRHQPAAARAKDWSGLGGARGSGEGDYW
jgi:hypothetical protein